ncbi:EF-hand domain-containing protein [Halobacteriales archaeon Cl-PHB]
MVRIGPIGGGDDGDSDGGTSDERQALLWLDSDGDGIINAEELKAALRADFARATKAVLKLQPGQFTSGAKEVLEGKGLWEQIASIPAGVSRAVYNWVTGFVWSVVKPLYKALYYVPILLVGAVSVVFLGSDRTLKDTVEGVPGLADIPVLLSQWLIGAAQPLAQSILDTVTSINQGIVVATTTNTGLAAAPLLAGVQIIELGVMLYLLWAGVQLASSIPGVATLFAAGNVATRPFRAAWEALR